MESVDFRPQQLIVSTNNETFNNLKKGIIEHIKATKLYLPDDTFYSYLSDGNPYPFFISKLHLQELKRIQEALCFAIKSIVQNYNKDSRIQETFNFSNEIKDLLNLCNEVPYENIGGFRPDYLYQAGTLIPKFCEINCRFPVNFYYMTYFGYNLINEYPELLNCSDGHFDYSKFKFEAINDIKQIENIGEKLFDINKPIAILVDKERGNAGFSFHERHKNSFIIKPSDLIYDQETNSITINKNGVITKIDQFFLELNHSEILALPKKILKAIVKSRKCLNDLRTIFIVHDKRFLNILSRDDILADYLDPFHHNIIKKHRIESILISSLERQSTLYKEVIENKNDWLIKPCLLGQGQGIIFGKNVTENEWNQLIESCLNENKNKFMLQKYVKQELFSYFDETVCSSANNDLELKQQNVVGTLMCFNDEFLGPGIFRTSPNDIVGLPQDENYMIPLIGEYLKQND